MWELLLISACVSGAMLGAAIRFYKNALKAQTEYNKARNIIEDIIISFNKQLENHEKTLNTLAYKVETAFSRADSIYMKNAEHKKSLDALSEKVKEHDMLKDDLISQLKELHEKISDITQSQNELAAKVSKLEETKEEQEFERGIQTVIPIRREKALAPLNDTELAVLKILADEGEKSAPQIRERINLSREHTARLMKKLYEEGYLERDTRKIPYTYKIKEEMRGLLEKVKS